MCAKIKLYCLCLMLFVGVSCKKNPVLDDAALQLIPKTAWQVTSFQLKSLMAKSDYTNSVQLPVFQDKIKTIAGDNSALSSMLLNPKAAGVNTEGRVYFFVNGGGGSPNMPTSEGSAYTAFVVNLLDATAFEAVIKSAKLEISDMNDCKMTKKGDVTIAWNAKTAFVGTGEMSAKTIASFFVAKKESSVVSEASLADAFNNDKDINTWISSNPFTKMMDKGTLLQMKQAGFDAEALNNNFATNTLNFEAAKMVGKSSFMVQSGFEKQFGILFSDKVSTDFGQYLPQKQLYFSFVNGLSTKGIVQFIKEKPQMNGLISMFAAANHISIDNLSKGFGGDICLALYNDKGVQSGAFMMNIIEKEAAKKLLGLLEKNEVLKSTGTDEYMLSSEIAKGLNGAKREYIGSTKTNGEPSILLIKNNILCLTDRADIAEQFRKGGYDAATRLSKDNTNLLTNSILGQFSDGKVFSDSIMQRYIIGNSLSLTRKGGDFELNTANKTENALKSLLFMYNEQYLQQKSMVKKEDALSESR